MTYSSAIKTILIGKESTWGTAVTANKDIGLVTDIDDGLDREVQEHLGMGSVETQQVTTANVDVNGSFTCKFQHGRLLEYIFGSESEASSSGDYQHTFTVADTLPSFTLESSENETTDTNATFEGCMVDSAEFTITNTEPLMLKVEWKGESVTSSDSSTASTISTLITYPKSLATVTINSVGTTEIQEFTMAVNNKIERSWGVGSNLPQQGRATEMKFTFSGKIGFDSKVEQEWGIGGSTPPDTADPTGVDVKLEVDNGSAYGSGKRGIELEYENCQFTKYRKTATIGDLVFIEFEGVGTLKTAITWDDITGLN